VTSACLSRYHRQFHDRVDFPDGKMPIVIASVGVRVSTGVSNIVKGSSNHGDDWMSRHVHCISVVRKKRESCVCPREHRRAKFAPRAADRKFDDDSSASAIGIFHENVKVAVVFHLKRLTLQTVPDTRHSSSERFIYVFARFI
jgi:hypothetical protein